jgi:hypothetical protein
MPFGQSKLGDDNTFELSFITEGNRIKKDEALIDSVRKMIKTSTIEDHPANSYFNSITTKPIISQKPVKPFMKDYPLAESERLKVCETKVFVLKSYVNYLQ